MKKFICAILICLMLPLTCFALAGCDDEKYDLKDFYTTYQNIGNNATNLKLIEANDTYQLEINAYKIDIDYSKSSKLLTLVDTSSSQYYQLKHFYQQLLDDTLSPLYFFGETIASSKKVSDKQTKQLFESLYELEDEYEDIDYYVGILINSLEATNDSTINLSNLKKVFLQYEQAIDEANKLSTIVCDIYFNTISTNTNVDYSSKTYNQLSDTDLAQISINTRKRMYYYKSVYANIYNQLYVREANLAETIVSSTSVTLPNYAPYTFITNISSLDSKSSDSLSSNKQDIYNNIVSLYNIQKSFDIAYNNFNIATSKIAFAKLDASSTTNEQNYGTIINQFAYGIAYDSYEILANLVDLMYL